MEIANPHQHREHPQPGPRPPHAAEQGSRGASAHGWKHKGHLHRPALSLAARIRDHRRLTRTTRGCASKEGYPGHPPWLNIRTLMALSVWSNCASTAPGLTSSMCNNHHPTPFLLHTPTPPSPEPQTASTPVPQHSPIQPTGAHGRCRHLQCTPPPSRAEAFPATLALLRQQLPPGEGQENGVQCCSPLPEGGEAQSHPALSLSLAPGIPAAPERQLRHAGFKGTVRGRACSPPGTRSHPPMLQKGTCLPQNEGRDLFTQLLQSLLPTLQDHELPLLNQSKQDWL